jgi:DNA polymerase III delta subunit
MLSIFYGTDRAKVNDAAAKRLGTFLKENKGAEVFALGDENFSESELERHIGSVGLFTGAHAVVVSHLLTHEEYGEALADHLASLVESENLFILKEGKLLAKQIKLVEKYADESKEFIEKAKTDKKLFPIFDLANSLGLRDKKSLWLGYQKAFREGVAPEVVHSILMWQVKTMLQVLAGATDDIKPFVLGKAKTFLTKYSPAEVKDLSFRLISLYHDSRRGLVDFEKGLEKIILSL